MSATSPKPKMSTGKKWLTGIAIFLGIGLIGGLMEALGVLPEDTNTTAPPPTSEPATSDSTTTATDAATPDELFWPDQPTDGVWALVDWRDPDDVVPFGQTSPASTSATAAKRRAATVTQ